MHPDTVASPGSSVTDPDLYTIPNIPPMPSFLIRTLVLAMLLCYSTPNMAQGDPPPDDPGNDPALPVDGGLSLLLAAGAAYGGRKLYRTRRENESRSSINQRPRH
jgi:hypothetical protein